MAGRKPGFRHSEETRKKIKATQLVNRLHKIAMGEVPAEPTQVNAAKALLNKVLPDLKAMELSGPEGAPIPVTHISLVPGAPADDDTSD